MERKDVRFETKAGTVLPGDRYSVEVTDRPLPTGNRLARRTAMAQGRSEIRYTFALHGIDEGRTRMWNEMFGGGKPSVRVDL